VFRQPVVFVIGAGASKEYGLPLGTDLKNTIASEIAKFAALHDDISVDVLAVTGALRPARSASSARPYRRGPRPRRTCRLRGDKK
jgi:hypothetical protein